ncbi:MAG: Wzz/FepE/Etk N-terminal domain-containing protein [bacterium]|nr:Wzz/FepE/Etk N-terminal domain-containing protein [bacterium]
MNYLKQILANWRVIAVILLATITVSLIASSIQKPQYAARGRILITQKTSANMDMYKASQSAERLAMLFAKIIKSSTFFKDVLNSGFPIDKTYFPKSEKSSREKWAEMVSSRVSTDTSIIEIDVYHRDAQETKKILNGIIYNFSEKSKSYYNLGDEVGIVVLDTPLVSERPVKPNLLLNLILGFLIGLVISAIFTLWQKQNGPDQPEIPQAPAIPNPEEKVWQPEAGQIPGPEIKMPEAEIELADEGPGPEMFPETAPDSAGQDDYYIGGLKIAK